MPIRIKPIYDLGPCILDSESIEEICTLIGQHFNQALFSAEDNVWEVVDEDTNGFLSAIAGRKTLDSFKVMAENAIPIGAKDYDLTRRSLELKFDAKQALLKLSAPVAQQNSLEHFLSDLKKHLRPPKLEQRLLVQRSNEDPEPLPFVLTTRYSSSILTTIAEWLIDSSIRSRRARYCYIILKKDPPNPFTESIKANLVSNVIWVIIVFVAGIVFALLAILIFERFDINLYQWLTPPTLPTVTPIP